MPRFGSTGKVVVKADESLGVWHHINHLRQTVYDLGEELEALDRKINGVKNAQPASPSDTDVFRAYHRKDAQHKVEGWNRWKRWAIKTALGAVLTSPAWLWIIKMVWAGMHAH
jgi:hypothetical protein